MPKPLPYKGFDKLLLPLGVIQGQVKGVIQHNVLLLDEQGLPWGLFGQEH